MNWKGILPTVGFMLTVAATLPLRAQTGCADSPEDPTLVLALVACAGGLAAGVWRARIRKRGIRLLRAG